MPRYELNDFEWGIIEPHLPNKVRGVASVDDRGYQRRPLALPDWIALGRCAGGLRTPHHLLQPRNQTRFSAYLVERL